MNLLAMGTVRRRKKFKESFFSCRICRSVALATFLAIIIVEIIIFIPSYHNFSQDWQNDQIDTALTTTQFALLASSGGSVATPIQVSAVLNELKKEQVILDWRILGADPKGHVVSKPKTEALSVLWSQAQLSIPFDIEVIIDMSGLADALTAFVWRIAGLVAVISIFVTVVTMYVLHRHVLKPILALRTYAHKASGDADNVEPLSDSYSANNEIGDVIKAFNDLLSRISDNLKSAHYDDLTKLPNRSLGSDRLRQAVAHAKRKDCSGAVLFIDIDNFKEVNDTMGHNVGDELLKRTAERLLNILRSSDSVIRLASEQSDKEKYSSMIARFGGDEFMVILPELALEADISIIAKRLSEVCADPFQLYGREVLSTVSIGIAVFPRDADNHHDLMRHADTALYSVKDSGRNDYRFYSLEMNSKLVNRLDIELQLRHALAKKEFTLHYQPLFDIKTQKIIGAEALLRWQNESLGVIGPDEFIPIAESSGLIVPIGEWVIEQACMSAAKLKKMGFPIRIAVNVSARQFRDNGFVDLVKDALKQSQLGDGELEIEITESLLANEKCESGEIIKQLKPFGVRFSIDDFGTGYSALSYLRKFEVDTLKIDRAFIAGVTTNEKDASLVRTIIDMAKNFSLEIIAEGVEDQQQLDFLMCHDCDIAQGYYLGPPMPYEDLLESLKVHKTG
ncbi:MAG: EAL domain-containing protein [Thiotrichales bacterium]|nr:EAL domain-containing protein [Thiotrichales bacterium]